MADPQRIAKLLARAGVASRREIERMIEDRRIAIDGVAIETPATIVKSLAGVTVDGEPVSEPDHARLFLYHKPTGLLTAANDPGGRQTIYDRMPAELPRVVPVGRLDLNTEGLLLLTTDGGLKRQLELPATGLERTYRARCYGQITQVQLETLSEGIEIEGIRYGSIDANIERRTGANVWIEMRLREGKNREVRRVLEYFGLVVNRLIRTAYGPFVLADLAVADAVEVLQHDLVGFLKDLKADPGARAARGTTMPRVAPVPKADAAPRAGGVTRATGAPRPVRPAAGSPARPARPGSDRPAPASDQGRVRRSSRDEAAPARPGVRPTRPNEREAPRPSRANPHKSHAQPGRPAAVTRTAETPESAPPAKQFKGKGWAKATRPTKKVGVGIGKRTPTRTDRPMTDERVDYNAEAPPRPARPAEPAKRHWRAGPAGGGAAPAPATGSPRPPRAPAPGTAPRAPRADRPDAPRPTRGPGRGPTARPSGPPRSPRPGKRP